ncbi:MAG: site-specific integrase [Bacteroidales bacterium]|nr:site-specific integrase [Bacteroidales bacterium]
MEKTFGVLVYMKIAKPDKNGCCPVVGRITVDGKRQEIYLKIKVHPDQWDASKGRIRGTREEIRFMNETIDSFRAKVLKIYQNLINNDEIIDVDILKNIYLGVDKKSKTVIKQYEEMLELMKERLGIDYTESTLEKYENTLKHVKDYIAYRYEVKDKLIKKLDHQFINAFEHYLKVKANNSQSSVYKHIQRFRKAINISIAEGVIDKDPFIGFRTSKGKSDREFLTRDELERIEKKELRITRASEVRDAFIFSCYTGIAWVDVTNLTRDNIIIGIDGNRWITGYRQKTKSRYSVPLLPKALAIIEKYKDHPKVKEESMLLPLITAQKTNSYLKEIADLCEINKNLTFHVARHTFATTVTLTNGVPIETVSKMLGHQSITTTQIYSKVVETKVSNDMNELVRKLS